MSLRPAVKFRRKVYIGEPRHKDALDNAFKNLTRQQQLRAYGRIADGKEEIIFGWVDKTDEFQPQPEYQGARMIMYGFD